MTEIHATVIDLNGAKSTHIFYSEAALVEYLVATYETEAPISLEREDGTPLDSGSVWRISEKVFALRGKGECK